MPPGSLRCRLAEHRGQDARRLILGAASCSIRCKESYWGEGPPLPHPLAGHSDPSLPFPFSLSLQHIGTMWIQVRTMDGKETHTVDSLSRLTKVQELRKKISELFHVEPQLQRLFYRGKQVS